MMPNRFLMPLYLTISLHKYNPEFNHLVRHISFLITYNNDKTNEQHFKPKESIYY